MRWPMAFNAQLCLQSVGLACAAEWQPAFPGWCLFQVTAGQGYWLAKPGARQMSTGDLAVLSPLHEGHFLTSQLLLETNVSIAEVAKNAGYNERGQFDAAFAKRFGVSPEAGRRPPLKRRPDQTMISDKLVPRRDQSIC